MKKLFALVILSLIVLDGVCPGTTNPNRHAIGLQLGMAYMKRDDQQASPLTYEGSHAFFSLSYGYRGQKSILDFSLSFSQGTLETGLSFDFGDHMASAYRLQLRLSYLRLLKTIWNGRCRILVGGSWFNRAFIGEYRFYSRYSLTELIGEITSEVDLSLMAEWKVGKKALLRGQVSLPILTFLIRSGYSGLLPVTMEAASILRFTSFWTQLTGESPIARHFRLKLGYAFQYYRFPDPRPVRFGEDTFFGELAYTW